MHTSDMFTCGTYEELIRLIELENGKRTILGLPANGIYDIENDMGSQFDNLVNFEGVLLYSITVSSNGDSFNHLSLYQSNIIDYKQKVYIPECVDIVNVGFPVGSIYFKGEVGSESKFKNRGEVKIGQRATSDDRSVKVRYAHVGIVGEADINIGTRVDNLVIYSNNQGAVAKVNIDRYSKVRRVHLEHGVILMPWSDPEDMFDRTKNTWRLNREIYRSDFKNEGTFYKIKARYGLENSKRVVIDTLGFYFDDDFKRWGMSINLDDKVQRYINVNINIESADKDIYYGIEKIIDDAIFNKYGIKVKRT